MTKHILKYVFIFALGIMTNLDAMNRTDEKNPSSMLDYFMEGINKQRILDVDRYTLLSHTERMIAMEKTFAVLLDRSLSEDEKSRIFDKLPLLMGKFLERDHGEIRNKFTALFFSFIFNHLDDYPLSKEIIKKSAAIKYVIESYYHWDNNNLDQGNKGNEKINFLKGWEKDQFNTISGPYDKQVARCKEIVEDITKYFIANYSYEIDQQKSESIKKTLAQALQDLDKSTEKNEGGTSAYLGKIMENLSVELELKLGRLKPDFNPLTIYRNLNYDWLYEYLQDHYHLYELVLKSQKSPLNTEELMGALSGIDIDKDNREFSSMLFTDLPETEREEYFAQEYRKADTNNVKEIIYNQNGYDEGITDLPQEGSFILEAPLKIGNPLAVSRGEKIKNTSMDKEITLREDIPIGYNIFLPKGKIKGVIVYVYGGMQIKDRKEFLSRPDSQPQRLLAVKDFLLHKGIVFVTLNLIDFMKLDVFQSNMSQNLQRELHASIHKFFDVMKKTPYVLHKDFQLPEKVKIFLFGGSFGGRTALRHAQLYPNTFDGYVSHDGVISAAMMKLSDRIESRNAATLKPWISPLDEDLQGAKQRGERLLEKDPKVIFIHEPVLLLHNFDDNNVNVKVTLDFYKEMINAGKNDLVQLLITKRGNPLLQEKNNKGHWAPTEDEAFKWYADTIASFIIEGPSKFPMTSKWMAHQYDIYAHKNYKAATLQEQFMSEAFRLYKNPYHMGIQLFPYRQKNFDLDFEKDWQTVYKPLFCLFSYIEFLKKKSWKERGEESKNLIENGFVTKETMGQAVLTYLPQFINFIKEKYQFKVSKDLDWYALSQNEKIQSQFYAQFSEGSPSRFYYFYRGNLNLWGEQLSQLISEGKFKVDEKELADAKENLRLKLQEDQDLFKDVVTENILVQNNPGGF